MRNLGVWGRWHGGCHLRGVATFVATFLAAKVAGGIGVATFCANVQSGRESVLPFAALPSLARSSRTRRTLRSFGSRSIALAMSARACG